MRTIVLLPIIVTIAVPAAAGDFAIKGDDAKEAERFKWGKRIREVEQGPEGALYVLEDGSGGRLLKLTPIQ